MSCLPIQAACRPRARNFPFPDLCSAFSPKRIQQGVLRHKGGGPVAVCSFYQPMATRRVFGFAQPMSLEYPPASLYGNAYCCMLMAWASIHCA